MAVGATAGLLIGYFASGSLDEPPGYAGDDTETVSFLTPTLLPPPAPGREPAFGLSLVQGRV